MRAGIEFDEDYDNVDADVRVYEQIYQLRPRIDDGLPRDALEYFATLRQSGEHGGAFRYSSILTDVLAWVLERASDTRFHELVARELWTPMGAEFDAEVTLDRHGNAMADGGICATLRDLARFGLQYLGSRRAAHFRSSLPTGSRTQFEGAPDGPDVFETLGVQPGFPWDRTIAAVGGSAVATTRTCTPRESTARTSSSTVRPRWSWSSSRAGRILSIDEPSTPLLPPLLPSGGISNDERGIESVRRVLIEHRAIVTARKTES